MSGTEICTQPDCVLRADAVDRRVLAEWIVRFLSGEDVAEVLAGKPAIQRFERCTECALRVLGGGRPLPTREEVERMLEAGQWSHRRHRRRVKHTEASEPL